MEKILTITNGVLLVIWMVGDILQGVSEKTPKRDLLSWACRRRDSPTNILISYTSLAVKCLAIFITIAELGILVSGITTLCHIKRRSKLIGEPWRVKA
ncbi:MAG: hypothetical protein Q9172_004307 [Xanthocarpia lactea]